MSDHTTNNPTNEIPYGYCQCGCGQKTKLASRNNIRERTIKGEPRRFLPGHNVRTPGDTSGRRSKPLTERFWSKVDKRSPDECWPWMGCLHNQGYGHIGKGGKSKVHLKAHRVAYELTYGEIPDGMCVCHHCDNPICVNPNHLFLGTHSDNMADKVAKGRQYRPSQAK